MAGTIKALVGCQDIDCATEVSYHLDMVRLYQGEPVCEECYREMCAEPAWSDLPPVTLADLCE